VQLRDRKLHEESNCTLPPIAAPPSSSSSNDDLACDGIGPYHLDHLLFHDVANNTVWASNAHADFCGSQLGWAAAMPPMGRLRQSRGLFMKRNHPSSLFADRGDGMQATVPKDSDYIGCGPKVMNGRQSGNFTAAHNSDSDTGKVLLNVMMPCTVSGIL